MSLMVSGSDLKKATLFIYRRPNLFKTLDAYGVAFLALLNKIMRMQKYYSLSLIANMRVSGLI
jgi:hypothetical protein